ncbi:MAG TPA: hypothetical protein VI816_02625 [Candidatus Bathyarchaeia archaeon]|nr:hypothetical protein [Candidatus Bathyarchaeia archaeon]
MIAPRTNNPRGTGTPLNRVIASLTLLLGLAALMVGTYAEQWNLIQDLVRTFLPFFG